MKYTSPAALPASDAAWIMLKEVTPSGKDAAQFAVEIGLARVVLEYQNESGKRLIVEEQSDGAC